MTLLNTYLNASCLSLFRTLGFMLCLSGLSSLAYADALRDPTQIPSSVAPSESGSTNSTQAIPQNSGPVLQSVILGAQYRAAIINGKKIKLGDKYEQARLVALSEYSATLRNPDGSKQTLTMEYSAVKKTPIKMSFQPPAYPPRTAEDATKTDSSPLISLDVHPNAQMK
jgi:MSHA biogenesis protein MshK